MDEQPKKKVGVIGVHQLLGLTVALLSTDEATQGLVADLKDEPLIKDAVKALQGFDPHTDLAQRLGISRAQAKRDLNFGFPT